MVTRAQRRHLVGAPVVCVHVGSSLQRETHNFCELGYEVVVCQIRSAFEGKQSETNHLSHPRMPWNGPPSFIQAHSLRNELALPQKSTYTHITCFNNWVNTANYFFWQVPVQGGFKGPSTGKLQMAAPPRSPPAPHAAAASAGALAPKSRTPF